MGSVCLIFLGSAKDLQQTHVTQPAVFVHSIVVASTSKNFRPDAVAGHSLGELSAMVVAKALSFRDGLKLVDARAKAMHEACQAVPSTMLAVLSDEEKRIKDICQAICKTDASHVVVPANYNARGQIVISGSNQGVTLAAKKLREAGIRRLIPLAVGGAFHSPLMEPAQKSLYKAIKKTLFKKPLCKVYQNVDAKATQDPEILQKNLGKQLTAPVLWRQLIENMVKDKYTTFGVCGPGNVLQGLMKKIAPEVKIIQL